jgi:hypothetical protein
MNKMNLMDKYPVYSLNIAKEQTTYTSVDEIIAYFKKTIEAHPVAVVIGEFDHYAHTSSLEAGTIAPEITDAKNLIFCFGKALPKAEMMGVRPRSFGVAQVGDDFVVSFMEAPNPEANEAMQAWANALINRA